MPVDCALMRGLSRRKTEGSLNTLGSEPWHKWLDEKRERVDITIDSGASTSMLPRDVATGHAIDTSGPPKSYKTAGKTTVYKDGDKALVCGFQNGTELQTKWEVGDIHRPLSSVSKMVRAGNTVCFDTEARGGSWIRNNATGNTLKVFERDGIYVLPAWIRNPAGFTRRV